MTWSIFFKFPPIFWLEVIVPWKSKFSIEGLIYFTLEMTKKTNVCFKITYKTVIYWIYNVQLFFCLKWNIVGFQSNLILNIFSFKELSIYAQKIRSAILKNIRYICQIWVKNFASNNTKLHFFSTNQCIFTFFCKLNQKKIWIFVFILKHTCIFISLLYLENFYNIRILLINYSAQRY